MKKLFIPLIIIAILLSLVVTSCNSIWISKTLSSPLFFGNGVSANIGEKNYLIYTVVGPPGTQGQGIMILDMSNPDSPQEISYLKYDPNGDQPNNFIHGIKLSGIILYIVTQNYLWAVDISNPFQPKEIGRITSISDERDIAISGKYLFVAGIKDRGIDIYDFSEITHPELINSLNIHAISLKISGSLLFALSGGMHIIDISSPAHPRETGFIPYPYPIPSITAPEHPIMGFFDIAIVEKYAYIVVGIDKLFVVDISNPSAPYVVSRFETKNQGWKIIISGKLAYLFSSEQGKGITDEQSLLAIVDVSDPAKLREIKDIELASSNSNSPNFGSIIEVDNDLYIAYSSAPSIKIFHLKNLYS